MSGLQRVVRAFSKRGADWVNWRKVNNLESHFGNRDQTLRCGFEIARCPGFSLWVENSAFAARKELVPGGCAGKLAFALDAKDFAESDQAANWVFGQVLRDS